MQQYLKCDADGCDHIELTEDYGPHLIGKPCPICGANLLTQRDYEDYEPMRVLLAELSKVLPPVDGDIAFISVNGHAGKTHITINDREGE